MAIYHYSATVIRRSAGRSATAAAAYRAGIRIEDKRTGEIHDYSRKQGVYGSEILAPEGSPEWVKERARLWNEVERVEKRKDSQLAREINVALPVELDHSQKQNLVRKFSQSQFVEKGMVADVAYHDFQGQNPHAHILLTMREINPKGFGKKNRNWNERGLLREQRESWSHYANKALERAGHEEKIDHRSLKKQGVERLPQIHLGPQVIEMEMRGVQTAIGDEMRRRSQINRRISRWERESEKLETQIAQQRKLEAAHTERLSSSGLTTEIEALKQAMAPVLEAIPAPQLEPQRDQIDTQTTHISLKSDLTEIKSSEPENAPDLESAQPIRQQAESASTVNRADEEDERRKEHYRQLYQHYSPDIELNPQQRDWIVLNRALSDGHEPVLALSIVGQGEAAQGIKNRQGKEAAIDYLSQLYSEQRRHQEHEQERRQRHEQEWER